MSDLPLLFSDHYELPGKEVAVVFLFFNFIILFFQIVLYYMSIQKFDVSGSLKDIRGKSVSSGNVYIGIKYAFIAAIVLTFQKFITHLLLVVTNIEGYFMVGFNSAILFSPVVFTLIYGTLVFQKRYRKLNRNVDEPKYLTTYVTYFVIIILFHVIFGFAHSLLGLNGIRNLAGTYMLSLTLLLILLGRHYYNIRGLSNNLINFRRLMIIFVLILINSLLFLELLFVPVEGQDMRTYFTRTAEVEILIFGEILILFFITLCYYFILSTPRWIRNSFGINEEEYRDYIFDNFGDVHNNTILLDMEDYTGDIKVQFERKILFFHSLKMDKITTSTLRKMKERNQLIEFFSLDKTHEISFEKVMKTSNAIFIINEINEDTPDILTHIESIYGWEVSLDEGTISVNKIIYTSDDAAFGLIIMIPSPWSEEQYTMIILCSKSIEKQILQYLTEFDEFIYTLDPPYAKILVFSDIDGLIQNVQPSSTHSRQPHENSYYLL